jgi:hypothetical protein
VRPGEFPALGSLNGLDGQAEVHDAGLAPAVDHDIRRLEITVDDPLLVGGGEPRTNLAGYLEGFLRRQPSDSF